MRIIIGLLCFLAASATAQAACVEVVDKDYSMVGEEQVGVDWRVTLKNSCDRSHDVVMTINFIDASGERLTSVREMAKIPRNDATTVGREIRILRRFAEQIEGMDIEMETRERPL